MLFSDEAFLEPLARTLRFYEAFTHISNHRPISLADLGCGPKIRAYNALKKRGVTFSKYIGIDPCLLKSTVKAYSNIPQIELVDKPFEQAIPLPENSVDYVISLAVLEHIDHPRLILNDIPRVLKPGGVAVLTTPTPAAKKVLEFLSYRLKLISEREIKEHKNYFTKHQLVSLIEPDIRIKVTHSYFELGLNSLLIMRKKKI